MTPISREEATASGLARFFTGKPCRNGHIAERLVSNYDCLICLAERSRRRRAEHPREKQAINRRYYAKNAAAVQAINAKWRSDNAERMCGIRREHYRENRPAYLARARAREAHIERATPPWADMAAIAAVYAEAARLTVSTGIPHEVDHIVPLRGANACGLHVPWNLQPLPAATNRAKGNDIRWPVR